MPGTSNFGHFDHFSYWKSQFCHFAYQRSVKMPFWPYFDPILSPPEPNLWSLAKMCLFRPTARMDLGGTLGDPNLTLFWPFWTILEEVSARPLHELPLGWRTCSEPHKPMPGTSNFGHFDHFSYWKSQFLSFCLSGVSENAILTLFWPHFEPSWAQLFWPWPKCAYLFPLSGGTLEGPSGTLIWP